MQKNRFGWVIGVAIMGAVPFWVSPAGATEPGPDGYVQTGVMVRADRSGAPYSFLHEVKRAPTSRTASGLVDAEVDKRFVITPLRDTSCADFRAMLGARLARSGARRELSDALLLACSGTTLRARSRIFLNYAAGTQTVTLRIERQGTTQISGSGAMRVVWNAWFGSAEDAADRKALAGHL